MACTRMCSIQICLFCESDFSDLGGWLASGVANAAMAEIPPQCAFEVQRKLSRSARSLVQRKKEAAGIGAKIGQERTNRAAAERVRRGVTATEPRRSAEARPL